MCIYSVCVCAHMCEFNWSFTYRGDLFIPETVSCQIKSPEPDAGYLPSIFFGQRCLRGPLNNAGYYHCSWLPASTQFVRQLLRKLTHIRYKTRINQIRIEREAS